MHHAGELTGDRPLLVVANEAGPESARLLEAALAKQGIERCLHLHLPTASSSKSRLGFEDGGSRGSNKQGQAQEQATASQNTITVPRCALCWLLQMFLGIV